MRAYIVRRLLLGVVTLWLVSVIIFTLVRLSGDPVYMMVEPGAPRAQIEALRHQFGFDRPLIAQYGFFIKEALRGNLGDSIVYHTPSLGLYLERLPATVQLVGVAAALAIGFGVLMGVLSALRVGGFFDTFGKMFAFLGLGVPSFWLGLMMILVFAVELRVLPAGGRGGLQHLVMPAVALAWYTSASYLRLTRSSLLEVLGSEYIKLARIKGLPELLVVGKHALRNGLIPVVSFAGMQLVLMINAAVVVEIVFAWPGIGLLLYDGIMLRDYPVVQTAVIIAAALMVGANLLVDILYAYIDPRIRLR